MYPIRFLNQVGLLFEFLEVLDGFISATGLSEHDTQKRSVLNHLWMFFFMNYSPDFP